MTHSTNTLSARKQTAKFGRFMISSALTAATLVVGAGAAYATSSPMDGTVTNGSASTTKSGNEYTTVQTSDRAITEYNSSLLVKKNEKWRINQTQGSESLSAHRVLGRHDDPSKILGELSSNGRVLIIDPNGVFFGAGSRVDTAGIIATTGDISNDQIMNNGFGEYTIENMNGTGSIELNGQITVAEAGLAAFVAPTVKNNGVINAKLGKVAFASGEKVTLDLYGDKLVEIEVAGDGADALLENTGTIDAEGGHIQMTAASAKQAVDNIINVEGVVTASSATRQGGKIVLGGGDAGTVKVSGKVDASGTDGGSIEATGDNVHITQTAELSVDGGKGSDEKGNGGEAYIYGNKYAIFEGSLTGRGGNTEGDGGNAEISATDSVGYYGLTDLGVTNGAVGTLLIDPEHLTISSDAFDFDSDFFWSGGMNGSININDQALANALRNNHVNLWATETLSTESNIDISTWENILCGRVCQWLGGSRYGITDKNLTIAAPTVNLVHDITLGNGQLNVNDLAAGASVVGWGMANVPDDGIQVDTLNLDGRIYKRTTLGGPTSLASDSQINTDADTINVKTNKALIQQAVQFADGTDADAETVKVGDGRYEENVIIDKSLNLIGTGTEATTIIDGVDHTGTGITVAAHDVALNGMIVENFRYGINVDTAISNLSMDDIVSRHNAYAGLHVTNTGSIDGLGITNSHFDNNDVRIGTTNDWGYGWYFAKNDNDAANTTTVTNVTVSDTSFNGNTQKGMYVEKLENATFENITIENSGTWNNPGGFGNAGIDINLKNGTYEDISFNNLTVTNSGLNNGSTRGTAVAIKARNDGSTYGTTPATLSGLTIKNSDITAGGDVAVGLGYGIDGGQIKNSTITGSEGIVIYNGVSGLKINKNTISSVGQGESSMGQNVGVALYSSNGNKIRNNNISSDNDGLIVDNSSAHIELNTITGTDTSDTAKNGVFITDSDTSTDETVRVLKNDISGFGEGIDVRESSSRLIAKNNFITGNKEAINFGEDSDGSTAEIYDNDLSGNEIGIENDSGEIVDASFNWWGSNDEATVIAYQSDKDGGIDVSPYQGEGIDTDGNAGNGYQGNFGNLYVTDEGAQTSGLVQEAIDAVDTGGDVTVNAGLYTESIVIDKALKLTGVNGATLKSDGLSESLITVTASDVNIDPFAFVGDGSTTLYGIHATSADNLIVDGNSFTGFVNANINVTDSADVKIFGNTMTGAAKGISGDKVTNIQVYNNEIYGTEVAGIHIANSDGTGYDGGQDDIDIWGNTVESASGTGIWVENSAFATIGADGLNPFASGYTGGNKVSGGDAGIVVDNSDNAQVIFSTVDSVNGDGIAIDGGENVQVVSNKVGTSGGAENIQGDGIYAHASDGVVIKGNKVERTKSNASNKGNGIQVVASDDAVIGGDDADRNIINNTDWDGISVIGGDNVTIDNNKITKVERAGIFAKGLTNSAVTGNIINNTEQFRGIGLNGGNTIEVSGNTIDNTAKDGIYVLNTQNADIRRNAIGTLDGDNNIGADGVRLENAHGAKVVNNDITNTASPAEGIGSGIQAIDSNDIRISRNDIWDTAWDGIRVEGGDGITVVKNDIDDVARVGIWINDVEGATVTLNGIYETGLSGIRSENSSDVAVLANWIGNTGTHGVSANNVEDLLVSLNVINDTTANGVDINGSDEARIIGNFIGLFDDPDSIGDNGIYVANSDDVKVKANVIRNTRDHGIEADLNGSQDILIGWNNIQRAGWDGINVDGGSHIDIRNNKIENIQWDGIEVRNSHSPDIYKNTIRNVGLEGTGEGIEVVNSAWADIYKNTIDGTSGDGIEVQGSDNASIVWNRIDDNGSNGIFTKDSNKIYVGWNKVTDSYYDGIRIVNAQLGEGSETNWAAKIVANFVNNSGDDGIEVHGAGPTFIGWNAVMNSGYNNGTFYARNNDSNGQYGSNGIHVGGAYGFGPGGQAVKIIGNYVDTTADDGIEVHASGATNISNNIVKHAGYGRSVYYGGADEYGADGIAVRDVFGADNDGYAVTIKNNKVDRTGDDGIEVAYAGRTIIENNEIDNAGAGSGELYFGYDSYGSDGIHVREVNHNSFIVQEGISEGEYYNYAVNIIGNDIDVTGDDGIEVLNSGSTVISDNTIQHIGYGDGEYYGGGDFYGADGIHVRNVQAGQYYNPEKIARLPGDRFESSDDTIGGGFLVDDEFREYSVVVEDNIISNSADDGVQVLFSGDTRIAGNTIINSGTDEGARIFGGDGINVLAFGQYGETGEAYTHIELIDNVISNSLDDGAQVMGTNIELLVDRNDITNAGDTGISVLSLGSLDGFQSGQETEAPLTFALTGFNSTITNNSVTSSGNTGLSVENSGHNSVEVFGNSFTDNPVGARFESGQVDISNSGNPNTFTNTNPAATPVGLQFDGSSETLSIVGQTIGATTFDGFANIGSFYVRFEDGSILDPVSGDPLLINGLDATFDGFTPPADGILSQAQLNALEARIYDADDAIVNGRGQLFVGFVPEEDSIENIEDFFNRYGAFAGANGNIQVTISRLPYIQQPTGGAQGFSPAGLNNIAPAAGEGENDPEGLAGIEPAAGGDENAEEVSCWGDAASNASGGQASSFSFGNTFGDESLAQAAGCNTASAL